MGISPKKKQKPIRNDTMLALKAMVLGVPYSRTPSATSGHEEDHFC